MKKKAKLSPRPVQNISRDDASSPSNFIILLIFAAYLYIEFLPNFLRIEIIKPQFLYLNVLNIAVGFYIYSNRNHYSRGIQLLFKRAYVFIAYLGFIFLSALSIFWARNTSLVINNLTEILVVLSMLTNFTLLLYKRADQFYRLVFLVGTVAFFQSVVAFFGAQSSAGSLTLLQMINGNLLNGNTGNINIFSASILSKWPFILIGISYFKGWKRWFLALASFLIILLVFLLSARTAIISLIITSLFYLAYRLISEGLIKKTILNLFFFIVPLVLAFIFANIILSNNQNIDRFKGGTTKRLGEISLDNQSDRSVQARLLYLKNTLNFIKDKPLTGIGLGNYRVESIPFEKSKGGIVSLHSHNDFLEIAAETGILNGLIYLSIFIGLLIMNVKTLLTRHKRGTENKTIAALALMLLVIYSLDSLLNFPMYRPTMQLCFCFLLAFTFNNAELDETEASETKNKARFILPGILAVSFFTLYFTYYADKTSRLEYQIKADNIDLKASGKLNGDYIAAQHPLIPNVLATGQSFAEYAGIYYFRAKNYPKAIEYLDFGKKINPYLGRPDYIKHYMAYERGLMDSAYLYIKSCYDIAPANQANFRLAANFAARYKDTLQILNMYQKNLLYAKDPVNLNVAIKALKLSGYSAERLNSFVNREIKSFPGDTVLKAEYNDNLILQYLIQGQKYSVSNPKLAYQNYLKALAIDSENAYALQNIGLYYYNLHQYKDAIPYLLKSIRKPILKDGNSEFFAGICYFNIRDQVNACKYLDLAKKKGYAGAQPYLDKYCK